MPSLHRACQKIRRFLYLRRSIQLVWQSTPGWTTLSIVLLFCQGPGPQESQGRSPNFPTVTIPHWGTNLPRVKYWGMAENRDRESISASSTDYSIRRADQRPGSASGSGSISTFPPVDGKLHGHTHFPSPVHSQASRPDFRARKW